MNKLTRILALILAMLLVFCACGKTDENTSGSNDSTGTPAAETGEHFLDSDYVDNNGRFLGVNASSLVTLPEYKGIKLHDVDPTETEVLDQINSILADYTADVEIVDRAVENGDEVNIDYVGSVDGVEFDGGNSQGNGAQVTAGSNQFIDDFLTQIIGHMPGETFDVNVTFPEDYGETSLAGKDALFVTTINYIYDSVTPSFTDEDIAEYLADDLGVSSCSELRDYAAEYLHNDNCYNAIQDYLFERSQISEIPQILDEYQKGSMRNYYETYANYYGIDLATFLLNFVGVSSMDELYTQYAADMQLSSEYYLIMQAIAERENITVDDAEVTEFVAANTDSSQIDSFIEFYGMNYLKMMVIQNRVMDYIKDNAIIE